MALPPSLKALSIGDPLADHCLEIFVDHNCPFSCKLLHSIDRNLLHLIIGPEAPYAGKIRIVTRPYPQPWHVNGVLLAEAALASAMIARKEPEAVSDPKTNAFWVFSLALMAHQEAYFDGASKHKNPDQIRAELVNLAIATLGEGPKKQRSAPIVDLEPGKPLGQSFKDLLRTIGTGNDGSQVTPLLKYCCRVGRQNGVHVTPTACWNGLLDNSISSSFGEKEWLDFLEKNVGAPRGGKEQQASEATK